MNAATKTKIREMVGEGFAARRKTREVRRIGFRVKSALYRGELSNIGRCVAYLDQARIQLKTENLYGITLIEAGNLRLAYLPTGELDRCRLRKGKGKAIQEPKGKGKAIQEPLFNQEVGFLA